jgi:hypothetical protein
MCAVMCLFVKQSVESFKIVQYCLCGVILYSNEVAKWMPVTDDYEVGRIETNWMCLVTTAMSFAETRINAPKYLTRNDTSSVQCSYLMVSFIHPTLNKLFIKQYGIGWQYNMLSLFIEIRMAPLILRTILSNVVTVLTCTSCSLQAVFIVSLLVYYITRKSIALNLWECMFYVQNCWTNFD